IEGQRLGTAGHADEDVDRGTGDDHVRRFGFWILPVVPGFHRQIVARLGAEGLQRVQDLDVGHRGLEQRFAGGAAAFPDDEVVARHAEDVAPEAGGVDGGRKLDVHPMPGDGSGRNGGRHAEPERQGGAGEGDTENGTFHVGSSVGGMAGPTRRRASRARAVWRSGPARKGLMSSSRTRGWRSTSWARRSRTSARTSRSAPGSPRTPSRSLKPRMPAIMSRASEPASGGTPKRTSWKTSTYLPPRPNMRSGPKRGSVVMPKITSWPPRAISWTRNPSLRWPARSSAAVISASARLSSSSVRRSTRTAP